VCALLAPFVHARAHLLADLAGVADAIDGALRT
jgi:hypothetical protein